MCYGSGCRWEGSFSGECGAPCDARCPGDFEEDYEDYEDRKASYADHLHDLERDGDITASQARSRMARF